MTLSMIWAQARDGVIGQAGDIPWHLPEDQANFRRLTRGNPVVMGRATWDSLPERFRPLPDRLNIVLTRNPDWKADGATGVLTPEQALSAAGDGQDIWVIGGATVYAQFLPHASRLVVTEVDLTVPGDTFAPAIGPEWVEEPGPGDDWLESRTQVRYRILTYRRREAGTAGNRAAGDLHSVL